MGRKVYFIIGAIILMAGLAYWNGQRVSDKKKHLLAEGFYISHNLKGTPELLVDVRSESLAIVQADSFKRVAFKQITGVDYRFDHTASLDTNFRLEIRLANSSVDVITVAYPSDLDAEQHFRTLANLLKLPPK